MANNDYMANPDNPYKQVPRGNTGSGSFNDTLKKYSHATAPSASSINKRPSYIMVNTTGSFSFAYESGSLFNSEVYITASNNQQVVAGVGGFTPYKLDINPVAWKSDDFKAPAGSITFVYVAQR